MNGNWLWRFNVRIQKDVQARWDSLAMVEGTPLKTEAEGEFEEPEDFLQKVAPWLAHRRVGKQTCRGPSRIGCIPTGCLPPLQRQPARGRSRGGKNMGSRARLNPWGRSTLCFVGFPFASRNCIGRE